MQQYYSCVIDFKKLLPIIGILLLLYIILNIDVTTIIAIFQSLDPLLAFVSLFAMIPILLMINIQWQYLLRKQKIQAGFTYTLKNIFIGYFYGFVTPGGFGGYLRALYLKDETNEPLPKCLGNIIIFNTIDFITLLFLGAIGAIVLSSVYPLLFYLIIGVLSLVIFLLIFFLKKEHSYQTFTRLFESRIFKLIKKHIDDPIDSFYDNLPKFRDLTIPFILSFSSWLLQFFEFFLIAQLFNITIPMIQMILIIAVANVIGVIPVSIYGLGTRDATLISLVSIYAIVPERIISLSLFWYVIIWLLPSIVGAGITLTESKKIPKKSIT